MSIMIVLCRSQISLLQRAAVAVVFTFMVKFSQKLINYFDTNSPTLSLSTVFGLPNKTHPIFQKYFYDSICRLDFYNYSIAKSRKFIN